MKANEQPEGYREQSATEWEDGRGEGGDVSEAEEVGKRDDCDGGFLEGVQGGLLAGGRAGGEAASWLPNLIGPVGNRQDGCQPTCEGD